MRVKNIVSVILAISILFSSITVFSQNNEVMKTLLNESDITYYDPVDKQYKIASTVSIVENNQGVVTWTEGWYYVNSDVEIGGRITCNGEVNLILGTGATLRAPKGITVEESNSLTIYGQNEDYNLDGKLVIDDTTNWSAGIGGDNGRNSGEIVVNGGVINTTGSRYGGAGIGGGCFGDSSTIIINGGIVTATGGSTYIGTVARYGGAGIGGGDRGVGREIIINDGVVTAIASWYNAGINGVDITINGGVVTARNNDSQSAISTKPKFNDYSHVTFGHSSKETTALVEWPGESHDYKGLHWLKIEPYDATKYVSVIFDADIGELSNGEKQRRILVLYNGEMHVPGIVAPNNMFFDNWYDEEGNVINSKSITKNTIFTARYEDKPKVVFVNEGETLYESRVAPGSALLESNIVSHIGTSMVHSIDRKFLGWFDENDNELVFDGYSYVEIERDGIRTNCIVNSNLIFTAKWDDVEYDDDMVEFHKMTSTDELKAGAHYIVVVKDEYQNDANSIIRYSFGAGYSDSAFSGAVLVTQSQSEFNDGILNVPLSAENVMTLNSFFRPDNNYPTVSFRTNNGLKLKLGTDKYNSSPLFNVGGGTIELRDINGGWQLWNSGTRHLGFNYSGKWNNTTNGPSNAYGVDYTDTYCFYAAYVGPRCYSRAVNLEIYTDAKIEGLGEERYVEYSPLDLSLTDFQQEDEMLIVYTNEITGLSYALTPGVDGKYAVPVIVEGNVLVGDKLTTSIITDKSNSWIVKDSWEEMTDFQTGMKFEENISVLRNRLNRDIFDIWVSSSSLIADVQSNGEKQVYFYIDNSDFEKPQVRLHGDRQQANRYLGWVNGDFSADSLSYEDSITVRIYGPQRDNTSYQTKYARVTSLELLSQFNNSKPFIIVTNNNGIREAIGYNIGSSNWHYDVDVEIDSEGNEYIIVDSSSPTIFNGVFTGYNTPGGSSPYYLTYDCLTLIKNNYNLHISQLHNESSTNSRYWPNIVPFRTNPDSKGRLEYGSKTDNTIYLRGNGSNTYLCYGQYENKGVGYYAGSQSDVNRIPIEIYAPESEDYTRVRYTDVNGLVYETTYVQNEFTLNYLEDLYVLSDGTVVPEGTVNSSQYTFVGWTTDNNFAGNSFLSIDNSVNLYETYNDGGSMVKTDIREKYSLVSYCRADNLNKVNVLSIVDSINENGEIYLYPIYAVRGFDTTAFVEENSKSIIGISDWKSIQSNKSTNLSKEKWLGSLNVEIYKDGQLWGQPQTLYFSYHNDNAADLNVKFIWDSILSEEYEDDLYAYLSDISQFPEKDQVGHFSIDAVYTIQGNSESGLKYENNWLTNHGGQLDNVAGGTTVKIYVTTLYNIMYYLQNTNGQYKLLNDNQWKNPTLYSTLGTKNKFSIDSKDAEFIVSADINNELFNKDVKTDKNGKDVFLTDEMVRGGYNEFAYFIDERSNIISIADSPLSLITGLYKLKNDGWVLKDSNMRDVSFVDWLSEYEITGTVYGTGNTLNAYIDNIVSLEGDIPYTFHLYADIERDKIELPNTGDVGGLIIVLFGVLVFLIGVHVYRRSKYLF